MAPPRRRPGGPTVRLALAVAAMLVVVAGRPVLVGTDDQGRESDWIYSSGDRAYEIMSDDRDLADAILGALP